MSNNVTTFTQLPAVTGLNGSETFALVQSGSSARAILNQIVAYILAQIPFPPTSISTFPSRVVSANANSALASIDTGLLINKTIAGATSVALSAPFLSRMVFIKDMKGDAGTNNITLDAGSGKLINGQQTLVMNANFGTTMLIGMSATQWGTLI